VIVVDGHSVSRENVPLPLRGRWLRLFLFATVVLLVGLVMLKLLGVFEPQPTSSYVPPGGARH
jgi:hypothetical protein